MQGDKLLPRGQNVVGGGVQLRAPDRRRGDGLVDARSHLGQSSAGQFGGHGVAVWRRPMSKDVDQFALHPGGFGMAEFDSGEFLEMLVQQPRVVDDSFENERFAQGNSGAVAAMNGARCQLRARHNVRLAGRMALRANGERRIANRG